MGDEEGKGVVIRRYDPKADRDGTEAVERDCELGPPGAMSLHADLLGDPVARIRHSPLYLMLVCAVPCRGGRIVGVVRGTVKSVATGERRGTGAPGFANVGYILGLHVAASHRRMGIALMLVQQLERWFEHNGAEYAYIATDKSNKPSLRLFTVRCGYSEFRTPYLLVNPVHSHRLRPPRRATVIPPCPPTTPSACTLPGSRTWSCLLPRRHRRRPRQRPLPRGMLLAIVDSNGYSSPPVSWAVATGQCLGLRRRVPPRVPPRRRVRHPRAGPRRQVAARPVRAGLVPPVRRVVRLRRRGRRGGGAGPAPLRSRIPHWPRLSCDDDLSSAAPRTDGTGPRRPLAAPSSWTPGRCEDSS
ncbi:hypothetical protein HU200_015122 [Digitaria exilis]|uniref:N-acetyltransferase domain-containing protein n=1 Tax=Digitaria exilis TaxID=1010633 RepID=A0A835FAV8_9POAL|nr:hypothetical protein HU200_015122 [Digitaria exilis]